ncbi:MAG: DNA polymerase III subunit chi [Gallionellaceae bacterium]|jgi:DNA polymerase-3 subunit chi|nr:DNA polymerase III subunit chi [Gallionellaceae bacterium]
MTKIDFYSNSPDKLHTACFLSHKAMQSGLRVVIRTPDAATADALDALLWQYPETAFIPHCRSNAPDAATTPVIIDHDGETFPHNDLLISLCDECLPFFSRFEKLKEIVIRDENDRKLGRERFRFYRDRGYEIRTIDLNKPEAA